MINIVRNFSDYQDLGWPKRHRPVYRARIVTLLEVQCVSPLPKVLRNN